jgi:L-iditol 2-dehydrogenase
MTIKVVRRAKHTYPHAISLVELGLVHVDGLVTNRFPLHEGAEAFRLAEERAGLKVLIEP